MRVLWIIGNGFDLNLGLKTSYGSFCSEVYFKNEEFQADREVLSRLENNSFENRDLLWSDLEILLGKATVLFDEKSIDVFHDVFEGMGTALCDYLRAEQNRCKECMQDEWINEFWESITGFENRLAERDKSQLGSIRNRNDNIHYDFVSLNYTSCFDEILKKANEAHTPFDTRGSYTSNTSEVFHIHGTLENNGAVVFGISDSGQISNPKFAEDDDFAELWIKEARNIFYRNNKTLQLKKLISEAQYICALGTSMGETDSYIWRSVGKRIAESGSNRFVLFDRHIKEPGQFQARSLQKARKEALGTIVQSFEWDSREVASFKERLLLLPSETIFKFQS